MTTNGYLGRDALLEKTPRRYRDVQTNRGTVRIQSLTEGERSRYESGNTGKGGKVRTDARRRLICLCVVDGEGHTLLTEKDAAALEEADGAFTGAIFDEIVEHCGFVSSDFEEAAKNSDETPADGAQ